MISLYSGTPGSGKSLHASRDIIRWCKRGKGVITNFPCTMEKVKKAKNNTYLHGQQRVDSTGLDRLRTQES